MKKLFIAASLIIGMIAGAMVLSSFSEPKQEESIDYTDIMMADGWTYVGEYRGFREDHPGDNYYSKFVYVWEKGGMCGAYYWTLAYNHKYDPDEAVKHNHSNGKLMNSNGKWYFAYDGDRYIVDL